MSGFLASIGSELTIALSHWKQTLLGFLHAKKVACCRSPILSLQTQTDDALDLYERNMRLSTLEVEILLCYPDIASLRCVETIAGLKHRGA
jgi:hypothetical protein